MAVWFLNMTHCSYTLNSDDTVMVTSHEIAEHIATGSRTTYILFSPALTSSGKKDAKYSQSTLSFEIVYFLTCKLKETSLIFREPLYFVNLW